MAKALLLFFKEAIDFRDQFGEFAGILLNRRLFAQFAPTFFHFALQCSSPIGDTINILFPLNPQYMKKL